jgi:hypothetical protein
MPGGQDRWDQLAEPSARNQEAALSDLPRTADRPERGSLVDLRRRLERLPPGHPSSPYNDDLSPKASVPRLKDLELPLRASATDGNGTGGYYGHNPDDDATAGVITEAGSRNGSSARSGTASEPSTGEFSTGDWSSDADDEGAHDSLTHDSLHDSPSANELADESLSANELAHDSLSANELADDSLSANELGLNNGLGTTNGLGPRNGLGAANGFGTANGLGPDDEFGAHDEIGANDGFGPRDDLGLDHDLLPDDDLGPSDRFGQDEAFILDDSLRRDDRLAPDDLPRGRLAPDDFSPDDFSPEHLSPDGLGPDDDRAESGRWFSTGEWSSKGWNTAPGRGDFPDHDGAAESQWAEPAPAVDTLTHVGFAAESDGDEPVTHSDGSWEWHGRYLSLEEGQIAEEALGRCRIAEGRNVFGTYGHSGLTPAMRRIEAQLERGALLPETESYALKPRDSFKERLADLILRHPDKTAEELSYEVHDAIRYTFIFGAEHYADATLQVHSRLKGHGFELEARWNGWDSPEYKGVNSRWRDPAHDLVFEVRFHTAASWEVWQRGHHAYKQITDPATPPSERMRLRAMHAKMSAAIPAPPGCGAIPDFRKEGV